MRKNPIAILAALTMLWIATNSCAAADKSQDQPAKISTSDFFRRPENQGVLISPGGRYLAALVADKESTKLGVIDLKDMRITAAYSVDRHEIIYHFAWANDDRLVFNTIVKEGPLDEPRLTGHVFSGNADAGEDLRQGNDFQLRRESVKISASQVIGRSDDDLEELVGTIPEDHDHILIKFGDTVYSQNIYNSITKQIASLPSYLDLAFLPDHQGKVRMALGYDKDDLVTAYWDDANTSWKEVNRSKNTKGYVEPLAFAADNRHVFEASNLDAPTAGLFEVDSQSDEQKLIFRDDHVDVGKLLYGPDQKEPVGIVYVPDYPQYKFFEKGSASAKIYASLQDAFPDEYVEITSFSRDGNYAIVAVSSDVDPGQYLLLDLISKKLTPLLKQRPWIDSRLMASMNAITLKARDGLELRGYLTLPKGIDPHQLPLVVLPHGGPHGIRDTWRFDAEVQFLAYHGYAVLQINYRGSGGYGRAFQEQGFRHWGTTMQDDVTDATHWAISQGIADPARICVYGASYGGYAALMGAIREPDLYRCAVGYAGVYDLMVQIKSSDSAETDTGRAFLKKFLGDDLDDLKTRSPVYNTDKIKAPLFLIHGEDDRRVPIKNLHELTAALDKSGKPYETLVKNYEGHGFYDEANKVELYDKLLKFLDQHIGPNGPHPAATN